MTNQHSHHATSHSSVALGTGDLSHRRLGDFEIVRMIGRGGMGVVYEARQISLDRTVALKVLTGGVLASEHHIIRFQREAQAAAKLKHDNIVPIYAQDQQDGIYYYAMELVEGESLSQILKLMRANSVLRRDHGQTTAGATQTIRNSPTSKALSDQSGTAAGSSDITLTLEIDRSADQQSSSQLSPNTARRADSSSIFQQQFGHNLPDYFNEIAKRIAELADALFYAHTHHIIHRDIKPHNLIRDDSGRLRITDFGLSRMTSEPGVTLTGEFIGSPAYMSPEQMTGSRGNMDHRTDIYSLGATLYEWLTLQPPHPGDTPEQVIAHATTQEIIPPHQINRFVPVDLETICLKALAKHPNDRYASAADMADDLRRFVRGQAILARRAGPVERFIKMIRRHRVLTAASAVIILLTVIVAGLLRTNVQSEQTHQTHVQAIATERDQFKEEADLAKVEAEQLKQQLELLKDLVGFTQETGAVLIEAGPQIGQRLESIAQLESQPQPAKDSASKPSKTGDMLSTVAGSAGTMLSSVLQLPEVPQRQILSGSLAYEMVRAVAPNDSETGSGIRSQRHPRCQSAFLAGGFSAGTVPEDSVAQRSAATKSRRCGIALSAFADALQQPELFQYVQRCQRTDRPQARFRGRLIALCRQQNSDKPPGRSLANAARQTGTDATKRPASGDHGDTRNYCSTSIQSPVTISSPPPS